jgi:Tol biopolymer transport system component
VTADGLELYFSSRRGGNEDIWRATRGSVAEAWGPPAPVAELNTADDDDEPDVAADGLTIWFASTRPGSNFYDVWVATRADRTAPWEPPSRIAELSTGDTEFAFTATETGVYAVFVSDRATGNFDLFATSRPTALGTWGSITRITELSTGATDANAYLLPDGLTLFFDSGRPSLGGRELYMATRPGLGAPWSPPVLLTELNGPDLDSDPWVSPDLGYAVFTSDRSGDTEIYEATRE